MENHIPVKKEMSAYTYLFICPTWGGGTWSRMRNIIIDGDKDKALEEAKKIARETSGSDKCDVKILQKFYVSMRMGEGYPDMLKFQDS